MTPDTRRGGHPAVSALRAFLALVALVGASTAVLFNPSPVRGATIDGATFDLSAVTGGGVTFPGTWQSTGGLGGAGDGVVANSSSTPVTSPCYSLAPSSSVSAQMTTLRTAFGGGTGLYACTDGVPGREISATGSGSSWSVKTYSGTLTSTENGVAYRWHQTFIDDWSLTGTPAATPTPSPTPTPPAETPTPTPTPTPGPSDPFHSDTNRDAANVDLNVLHLAQRCRNETATAREAKIEDSLGNIVVSCQETPDGIDTWGGDVASDDLAGDTAPVNAGMGFYIGFMQAGGPFHVTGHTRPRADDPWQTWCWPGAGTFTEDCEGDTGDGLIATYGASATGTTSLNFPPFRHRVRAAIVASVVTEDGQTDYVCTAWPGMAQMVPDRGTPAFSARDAWTCPVPTGTFGDIYVRAVAYTWDDRFNDPRPHSAEDNQSYMLQLGYAVLHETGSWTYSLTNGPGPDSEWPWCKDQTGGGPCEFEPEGRQTSGSWNAPNVTAPFIPGIPGDCVDIEGRSCTDESAGQCPLTGEFKPGCAPIPDCDGIDVSCAVNNIALQMLGILIDLFMPGEMLGQTWDAFFDMAGGRVPFGWFAQFAETVEDSRSASSSALGSFNLTVGSASVSIGDRIDDALDAVSPFRGLIFAGIAMTLLLSGFRWLMAGVGVSPSKAASDE